MNSLTIQVGAQHETVAVQLSSLTLPSASEAIPFFPLVAAAINHIWP